MTHPVFFSFSGDAKSFAQSLKEKFSDDLVYMYIRTGADGIDFPQEILEEVTQCEIFVLFLSRDYVADDPKRPWCRRELAVAERRIVAGSLKKFLIIQMDDTPFDTPIKNPDTGQRADVLRVFRNERRAFTQPLNRRAIEQRLAFELAQIGDGPLPVLPRVDFQKELREALDTGSYQTKTPLVIVSGFDGVGRKTLIRSVMSSDFKHLTEYTIPLDSADGPDDLLRMIWGEVFLKTIKEQRALMKAVEASPEILHWHYRNLGTELIGLKGYIVISKDQSTDVDETLPFWVSQYLSLLRPSVQPLIFITAPRPLPRRIRNLLENCQELHLPTLEDSDAEELVAMHISARDPQRVARWGEHLPFILEAGANTPKLLVDIVRLAARRASLDFLKKDVAADIARYDERIVRIVTWAMQQINERRPLLLLLDVLSRLGDSPYETLKEIFDGEEIGESLYELVQYGLVENLSESIYRIPAALRRKLNFYLANPELRQEASRRLSNFAKTFELNDEDSGGIALTNFLHIRLDSDVTVSAEDEVFVTAAMLFKVGWQKYRRSQYPAALVLLRRAFTKLPKIRDEATKLEIVRFYGLAAVREGVEKEKISAIRFLRSPANFSVRLRERAIPTAFFIEGFSLRLDQQFSEAIEKYEQSLNALPESGQTDAQRAMVMNEMVQCLLKLPIPDYERAVDLAERTCAIRSTPNNLDILLRALVAQTFEDPAISQERIDKNFQEIDRREKQLFAKCEGAKLSFYSSRVIDRLEKEAIEKVKSEGLGFGGLDLSEPIRICHEAYLSYQEEALMTRKWDLMLRNEAGRDWGSLHAEVSSYLQQGTLNRMGRGVAARIRILTFDLTTDAGRQTAIAQLEKFRANGTIPKLVASEIRRKLDMKDISKLRFSELDMM